MRDDGDGGKEVVVVNRPMQAAKTSEAFLRGPKMKWPVIASPKLDGIRCIVPTGMGPVSRTFLPIPNEYTRRGLLEHDAWGLDGELIIVDGDGKALPFNAIQSGIMSRGGEPNWRYVVFDSCMEPDVRYDSRLGWADAKVLRVSRLRAGSRLQIIPTMLLHNYEEFEEAFASYVAMGYEGICTRTLDGPYKCGRSTENQGWLIKYKPFDDAEGVVVDFEELMHNANEDTRSELGYAKRSHAKDGMVPMNKLGALVVDTQWGELRVGTGFSDADRVEIWKNRQDLKGAQITFRYQVHGMETLPRFPVFKGFRMD